VGRLLVAALVWGLAAGAAGCRREPPAGASGEAPARAPSAAGAPADAAPAAPGEADAAPDPCVADCIAQSQMRATSLEQIERECRQSCAAIP
jgi:hypothetical protein